VLLILKYFVTLQTYWKIALVLVHDKHPHPSKISAGIAKAYTCGVLHYATRRSCL